MKPMFERALIALDLSPMDEKLLRTTAAMAPVMGIKKIYLLHIAPDFQVPENADWAFREKMAPREPLDEQLRAQVSAKAEQFFGSLEGVEWQVEIIEGKPFQTLLHWLEVKHVDVLIAGRKRLSEGSGITARRLARHSACHVLFVPYSEGQDLGRILAPVDFSPNSARSMKSATALAAAQGGASVQFLYVIDLPPSDYYMRNFDTEAFRQVLRQSARATCAEFMKENGLDDRQADVTFLENTYSNAALHIHEFAEHNGAGLIVMGAQGHAALERLLYGSVTEKLADSPAQQLILVIR